VHEEVYYGVAVVVVTYLISLEVFATIHKNPLCHDRDSSRLFFNLCEMHSKQSRIVAEVNDGFQPGGPIK
jgi:hypothetical protein